jgi:hypothetical protein
MDHPIPRKLDRVDILPVAATALWINKSYLFWIRLREKDASLPNLGETSGL